MAKETSLLTFIAGGIIGAAAVYLSCTENGKRIVKDGLTRLDDFMDKLSDATRTTEQPEAESPDNQ